MILALMLALQLCPPDAESATCAVGLGMFRSDGSQVGSRAVFAGEELMAVVGVFYIGNDPLGRTATAFHGGRLFLMVGTESREITPPSGIPWLGPIECAPQRYVIVSNTFVARASSAIRVEYVGGETGWEGLTVSGAQVTGLRVEDSPLRLQRDGAGTRIWFYGTGASYAIERSLNLRQWTEVGVFSPDKDGRIELTVTDGGFWRYRRL